MKPSDHHDEAVEATAAEWLARCDRGLSPTEQDAYLEWLRAHRCHGEAISRLKHAWSRLDGLSRWEPSHSASQNPDLLTPARRSRWRRAGVLAMAAALVVAGVLTWGGRYASVPAERSAKIVPGPERVVLEDGSLIELNAGSSVDIHFTRGERRVRLVHGEALFSVTKDPARPFIVDTGAYEVRAVGTAFCVQLRSADVAVLVTEGAVRLDESRADRDGATGTGVSLVARLAAGQQAVVTPGKRTGDAPEVVVRDLAPAEMDAALAWRAMHLKFDDILLRDVIVEFNRYNARQLVIHDAATGEILVGGSFRADNLDAFVRLLDSGFGVSAESRDNEIVLRRR